MAFARIQPHCLPDREGVASEGQQVQRRADHRDLEGAGRRGGNGGHTRLPWYQLGDALQVESKVWPAGRGRHPALSDD